jgi:hypothetical protein
VTASAAVMGRDLGLIALYVAYLHHTFSCPLTGMVERALDPLFFARLRRGDPGAASEPDRASTPPGIPFQGWGKP